MTMTGLPWQPVTRAGPKPIVTCWRCKAPRAERDEQTPPPRLGAGALGSVLGVQVR
jgi:hypothetical protein